MLNRSICPTEVATQQRRNISTGENPNMRWCCTYVTTKSAVASPQLNLAWRAQGLASWRNIRDNTRRNSWR